MMSPKLPEVTLLCNEKWIKNVWFFKECEEDFLIQVALGMTPLCTFLTRRCRLVTCTSSTGMVLYGGRVVSGESWGDDMLITRIDLQSRFSALALGYKRLQDLALTYGASHRSRSVATLAPRASRAPRVHLACEQGERSGKFKSSNSSSRSSNSPKATIASKSSSSSKPDIKYPPAQAHPTSSMRV